MFPVDFAFEVISEYSSDGDAVLDPFAGRASSIYAAAALGRSSYGVEINPVGWIYGQVKLQPATKWAVLKRLSDVQRLADNLDQTYVQSQPEFFSVCYSSHVFRFLLSARDMLQWRTRRVDATLMALLLVYLHGKYGQALSNQMRQGKAMSPDYSIRWWRERQLQAPDIDPVAFMSQRINWRYQHGRPRLHGGKVTLGDSTVVLRRLAAQVRSGKRTKFDLLFTSPPYCGITNYHYDQWLRLWLLGGPPQPRTIPGNWTKRFDSKQSYRKLLQTVFAQSADILAPGATVYVRTDARQFTYETTVDVLQEIFPNRNLQITPRPYSRTTQTALYGDKTKKPGEVDIVLTA